MDKTAIKNFAVWARRKLISEITYKAGLIGITEKGISKPLSMSTDNIQFFDIGTGKPTEISDHEIKQREALINRIKEKEGTSDYKTAFQFVIEEVAYTWFNRLIAIRFMEVNDYLPSRIRVLSSETSGKSEPDMVTTPFNTDMDFSAYEKDRIMQLKHENELDELFRMLFIKQCNKLNEVLPELFEKTADYTELLLTISFTDSDGMVSHLVNDIAEEDFTEAVEIIGWMYQYYNEERKNEVINIYKGTIKKEDIPAATQLFTTDWVVRYMVDNSLGRYWIERNPQSKLIEKLEYFVTPKNGQIQFVNEKVAPEELTFFDPCMGSGHILVYAFDVLMEIYRECGFVDRDAAHAIIENNIFGLDIDNRAYQLAYFAVMMKARSYDRRFLTREIEPNVLAINETNNISRFNCDGITNNEEENKIGEYLINAYKHAKELGSLISVDKHDYKSFIEYLGNCSLSGQLTLESDHWLRVVMPEMKRLAKQASIMSEKYAVVCTNPPYMNKLEGQLKKFVVDEYKPYSGDLFSVFMYRNFEYCRSNGYSAFMTPFVWMFIKTYEQLREYIIKQKSITTLVQMEYSAFEEATVPICSFVLKNGKEKEKGVYLKLSEFKGGMEIQKQKVLYALENNNCEYLFEADEKSFLTIPGSPIAYWVSNNMLNIFQLGKSFEGITKKGVLTGDDKVYARLWFEVSFAKIGFGLKSHEDMLVSRKKWFPVTAGGFKRKWYGNFETVINLENDGLDIRTNVTNYRLRESTYYMKEAITWTEVSSGMFSCRYVPIGILFGNGGPVSFFNNGEIKYHLGLLNSSTTMSILSYLAPTINYGPEQINKIPVIKKNVELVENIVTENVEISKNEWDSFETSWEFKKHPLLDADKIESAIQYWQDECNIRFNQLKVNEEKLNEIFIDIYGLERELSSVVEDKDVTVRKADIKSDIKSFISYAVGCMLGRYSLNYDGIAFAGGEWDDSRYNKFKPDKDNCIPITDEEYFSDDIVGRFVEFIKCAYGTDVLEDNIDFIANALDNKGNTSREIIRNYFLKDFYKDHIKTYQKRPIYWLYDSGKQDGFKALVYMHRYTADTTGIVRVDYLHKMQKIYMSEIDRMKEMEENSNNTREVAQAEKRKEKLIKQLKETKEYDEKIAHLALSRIAIDLDDGVKVNYEKVQTGQDGKKLDILAKI
ncbi:BREX-1 system adenine-specific DNA-methyltransferase PglX [Lacrimispora saccharolytica]|uniref:site-specific DNA-methyltransferase (adenine-specific) n=1 Tax=Lacrimispora saccharolytica (strain ATCC 35040 / DSM 2544 / NRCC 2533 / WM1) TaxID=610130 RepID=D9R6C4_LACSW|nr:BREX-1 system adenine-specific DNA-methyltransferase PglX [Lacrimispora saccharolytica]ADL05334.1 putative restriction enzyme [[Clostridium] saccharolyticum WM1]QRV20496.1 BREX-1 system adenine-specific DNA-methyltransferase PglX [Lacrimispora saccharolytica]